MDKWVWASLAALGGIGLGALIIYYAKPSQYHGFATGSYIGNGSTTTIAGMGFAPKMVRFFQHQTLGNQMVYAYTMTREMAMAYEELNRVSRDGIISLDSDGFTVNLVNGAGPNIDLQMYDYVAFG